MPRGIPVTKYDIEHRTSSSQYYLGVPIHDGDTSKLYQKTENPYIYSTLDKNQIRILTILPGGTNDDMHCILTPVDIETTEPLKYDALSYHWEESTEPLQTI
jgi:hypothetical protein